MIDTIGEILCWINIAEFIVFGILIMRSLVKGGWKLFFEFLSLSIGIVFFTFSLWWSMFLRDGLGPDSVTSIGQEAIRLTFEGFSELLFLGLSILILFIIIFFYLRRKRLRT